MALHSTNDANRIRRNGDSGAPADAAVTPLGNPQEPGGSDQSWLLPMLRQAQDLAWSAHVEADSQYLSAVRPVVDADAASNQPPIIDGPETPPREDRRTPDAGAGDDVPGSNPHGFLPPPQEAMVTMAVVEWTNTETGETWIAPSGGYQPPSEAWVARRPESMEPVVPDDGGRADLMPPSEDAAGDAAILPVDPWMTWTFSTDTITHADEFGNVIGYESITRSSDEYGNWTLSTQTYTADWRVVSSSYTDQSGFSYTFQTLWSEDGTALGHVHRYTGADNTYAIEVHFAADWRILSTHYEDPAAGYRSSSEFWYDEAGVMIGGTTTQTWTDETGPQSVTDEWWVDGAIASTEPTPETPDADGAAGSDPVEIPPDSETPPDHEIVPEIIVCPGEPEILPPVEVEVDGGRDWPTGGPDPVPEELARPEEPESETLEGIAWEDIQWDTGLVEPWPLEPEICILPAPFEPDICILPPPADAPSEFDPGWLRPAVLEFEPLVGIQPDTGFG